MGDPYPIKKILGRTLGNDIKPGLMHSQGVWVDQNSENNLLRTTDACISGYYYCVQFIFL